MRWVLMGAIKLYWIIAPASLRQRCIFKITCSKYVYETTRKFGLIEGLRSFWKRWRQCRAGYNVEYSDSQFRVKLRDGTIIDSAYIAQDVLDPHMNALVCAKEMVVENLKK